MDSGIIFKCRILNSLIFFEKYLDFRKTSCYLRFKKPQNKRRSLYV